MNDNVGKRQKKTSYGVFGITLVHVSQQIGTQQIGVDNAQSVSGELCDPCCESCNDRQQIPEDADELKDPLYSIVPAESIMNASDLAIYELRDGEARLLEDYGGIPSDSNYMNQQMAETNELFDQLLDIEEQIQEAQIWKVSKACNVRHPNFAYSNKKLKQKFYQTNGFRLYDEMTIEFRQRLIRCKQVGCNNNKSLSE